MDLSHLTLEELLILQEGVKKTIAKIEKFEVELSSKPVLTDKEIRNAKRRKMSLLLKAKGEAGKSNKEPSKEEVELAIAWAKNEVRIHQVRKAIDAVSHTKTYSFLARTLKYVVNEKIY